MALHRDIFWLGRQWAVTGFGIQAVDQRLGGRFDVEISRFDDEDPAAAMRTLNWFDADDFAQALLIARKRLREPPVVFRPSGEGER